MRFLIFSDLHIHSHPDFDYQVDHSSSRLLDCLNVLDKVKEYYDRYKCGAVLFGGDLFHIPRAVETSIYEPAFRRLEELTANVENFIAIAGNHDKADTSKGGPSYSSLYPIGRLCPVVVKTAEHFKLGNTVIHCLPYIKDKEEFSESLRWTKDNVSKSKENIVITHCSLSEASNGPNEVRLKDAWSIKDISSIGDTVFCGHHHHPERLSSKAIVIGSPIQHNMLDRGDNRGLVIYDSSTQKVKRIWLNSSQFHLIEINTPGELSYALSGWTFPNWEEFKNGYVRFIFRFTPPREALDRIEEKLMQSGVRGKEIKIQRAPLNSIRNEKLTSQLVKSNDFKSSIPTYVDHVKPEGLNIPRLISTGQKLIEKSKE